jgi:outer membrane protein TolC
MMSVRLRIAIVVLPSLILGRSVASMAQTKVGRELTLDQALVLARKANRSLVAERARLQQAQTSVELAWAALFPIVGAQGKYTRNNLEFKFPINGSSGQAGPPQSLTIQPKNQLDGTISFTAPLLAPAAYLALDAVKTGVHSAEADFESSEAVILLGVAHAFYLAAISAEVLGSRQSSLEVARVTLQNAKTRFTAGTVTKVDVDRAELALVKAEQAGREARFGQEQAYRALATLIQSDGGFQVRPLVPPQDMTVAPDFNMALHLRPEFRALELTVRSIKAQQRAHAWRWAPTLSAFGNARIFNYDNFAREGHAWAVGAQLDWLLFDGGVRDAQRHMAAAQAQEAEARAEALRDSIRDDLANASGMLETKRLAHDAAERQVELAVETLELVRIQYEAGNTAQIDLLQAQDGLVAAKEAQAQAHFEMAIADLTLRRAAGTFPGR